MNARTIASMFTLYLGLTIAAQPARAANDLQDLLRLARADLPATLVVVNFEEFDKSVISYVKAIDPTSGFEGMLADVRRDLAIGDWVDFSKPIAMGQANVMGGDAWVLWAQVPDFLEKAKALPEAKEEEGLWHFTFENRPDLFASVKGAYIIASSDKESLKKATEEGESLADALKSRMDLLDERDALVHVNVDAVRPMALGGIAQAAQMAPMIGMMVGAQGGGDPASMTAMITAVADIVKGFVEQIAYIEIAVGIDGETANVTLATGYNDGGIKNYLTKQKPAGVPLLTEIEYQPYLFAMGWHMPGSESTFFDCVIDKMLASMPAPAAGAATPPGEGAAAGAPSESAEAMKKSLEIARELYRKVQGMNMLLSMSADGMKTVGDYIGSDAQGILELSKKSMLSSTSMPGGMSAGMSFEPAGSKKIGDVMVEEFSVKVDTSNPAAAQAAMMFGENTRVAYGIKDGRVRYCMGTEEDAKRAFSSKVTKPLAADKLVAEAIAKLPAKRNAIGLVDPAGLLPLLGQMPGMPKFGEIPPGPPIVFSASLSGEPARVDIHIPARAIGRVLEAVSPDEPM